MVSGYDLLTIGCEHFWSWCHGDEARRASAIASSYPRTQDLINVREPESTRDTRNGGEARQCSGQHESIFWLACDRESRGLAPHRNDFEISMLPHVKEREPDPPRNSGDSHRAKYCSAQPEAVRHSTRAHTH